MIINNVEGYNRIYLSTERDEEARCSRQWRQQW